MKAFSFFKTCAFLGFLGLTASANAGMIAIINGASVTSETNTTSSITSNLNSLHIAAGNTTTILDSVPADLSIFDQVWDIRFSNVSAITAAEEAQYLNFLQNGGGMFVMGENSYFATRNNSVLSLIAAAGGGTLSFVVPSSTQDVVAPFTGPNLIPDGNVTYAAPGGVTSAGTGQFITVDASGRGTGVAFGVGDLTNASSGALTTIFDVNFMQGSYDQPDSQSLLKNLIQFVGDEVEQVPEPTTMALLGLGLAGFGFSRKKKQS